jgi:hypothetical protein
MMSFAMMVAIPAVASEYYQPGPGATGRVSAENWENGENRRYGLHNFEKVVRYTSSVRPTAIRKLQKSQDLNVGDLPEVNYLTSTTAFSGIVIVKGDTVIYEKYAPDFGPTQQHSCQSSTKTINNLLVGKLVAEGKLDLSATIMYHRQSRWLESL